MAWRSYVHNKFRDRTGPAALRQRDLVLDLSASRDPVPAAKIPELSPRLAKAYANRSRKTLTRDLAELEAGMGLIHCSRSGYAARREVILAFLPWGKGEFSGGKGE